MQNKIRILLADDHPLILKGLVATFTEIKDVALDIYFTTNCDRAYEMILLAQKTNPFHILFTDLSYVTEHKTINSGEELINKLKTAVPNLKIGVITGHSETNRVYNVIKNQDPLCYLLKETCTANEISFAIQKMLDNTRYYTHSVHQKILKRSIVQISMDDISLQILNELPKHTKISSMVGEIVKKDGSVLKLRSIEHKLSDLRLDLNAHNNTDLVLKAKELGIID